MLIKTPPQTNPLGFKNNYLLGGVAEQTVRGKKIKKILERIVAGLHYKKTVNTKKKWDKNFKEQCSRFSGNARKVSV